MKFTPARICCLCLTITTAIAFPTIRQETISLPKVKSYCTSYALKTILKTRQSLDLGELPDLPSDIPSDFTYLTSGIQNEIPYVTSGFVGNFPFERNYDDLGTSDNIFRNVLSELDKNEIQLFSTEKLVNKLASTMVRLRNDCMKKLMQASVITEENEKEDPEHLIGGKGDYDNGDFPIVLSESRSQTDSNMKRSDLGLNPTGWRKRRSGEDTDKLQKFLRNVRQLLEKRKRLEFNPTGW